MLLPAVAHSICYPIVLEHRPLQGTLRATHDSLMHPLAFECIGCLHPAALSLLTKYLMIASSRTVREPSWTLAFDLQLQWDVGAVPAADMSRTPAKYGEVRSS